MEQLESFILTVMMGIGIAACACFCVAFMAAAIYLCAQAHAALGVLCALLFITCVVAALLGK